MWWFTARVRMWPAALGMLPRGDIRPSSLKEESEGAARDEKFDRARKGRHRWIIQTHRQIQYGMTKPGANGHQLKEEIGQPEGSYSKIRRKKARLKWFPYPETRVGVGTDTMRVPRPSSPNADEPHAYSEPS